jgi:ABC-type polysaccharide/polyol phosphate transport system ATPase subunit
VEGPRQEGAVGGPEGSPPPEGTTIVRPQFGGSDAPLAIEARGLEKAFRIPVNRVDSLKERIVRPFSSNEVRLLRALDGVSFDVHQGEFFGIVGRNGSGKSTLLKLLASIYRADAGTIRMAGRLAPFIELGVGFNVDLTARENVILNGVMMGLTPHETRERVDAVIDFAELEEFIDLKLKNYSSGMLIRLAFSVMLQADADVLLIDEVLAVGDAAFQQKCADAFHEMKATGKTIILVTHEMSTVEEYCHRAMLIDGGKIQHIGDPDEVGRQYLRLNFEKAAQPAALAAAQGSKEVQLLDAWIEDADGARQTNAEHGGKLRIRVRLEALRDLPGLGVGFIVANADGVAVFQFGAPIADDDGSELELAAGAQVTVSAEVENLLVSGRYFVHLGLSRANGAGAALYVHDCLDFVVFGGSVSTHGFVSLPHEISTSVDVGGPR